MQQEAEPIRAVLIRPYTGDSSHEVDFSLLIRFLIERWIGLCIFTIIGASLLVAVSYAFPRTYRAEVLLVPISTESSSGGLSSLLSRYGSLASAVGIDASAVDSSTARALALIQSRQFIEKFVVDKSLMPILYPDDFIKSGSTDSKPKSHTLQDAYNLFVRKIMLVRQDKATTLVTIRIDWRDRILAAQWANELVDRVNASTRSDAIHEADESLEYLRAESKKSDYVALQQSIASIIEAQINKRMLASVRPDYSFKVIDPAIPSDANKSVSPMRILFLVAGAMLGFVCGSVFILRARNGSDRTP